MCFRIEQGKLSPILSSLYFHFHFDLNGNWEVGEKKI